MESRKVFFFFFVAQLIHATFINFGMPIAGSDVTLSETIPASLPLQIGLKAPKGNEKVFHPSIFRCENVRNSGRVIIMIDYTFDNGNENDDNDDNNDSTNQRLQQHQ